MLRHRGLYLNTILRIQKQVLRGSIRLYNHWIFLNIAIANRLKIKKEETDFKGDIYIMQMGCVGTQGGEVFPCFPRKEALKDGLIKNEMKHPLRKDY